MSEFNYELSAVAIMKYEEPYVAEWVAFHKVCGVQHFYIYDNNEQSTMREVLKPYIEQEIVTLIPWYGEVRMFPAYNHAILTYGDESKYMAFIDADEFLVSILDEPLFKTVSDLFDKFELQKSKYETRDIGGFGVNWKLYGTSNHKTKPEGLVIENYTLRGETEVNRHIKSIVNPRAVASWVNPHFANYRSQYRSVSQSGLYLSGPFCNVENWSPLRINHYFYKSEEEFKQRLKKKKCDVHISEEELKASLDRALEDVDQYNQIEDKIACRFVDVVKTELRRNGYSI